MKTIDEVIDKFNEDDWNRHLPPDMYHVELIEFIRENYKLINTKGKAVGLLLPVEDTVTRLIERNETKNKETK